MASEVFQKKDQQPDMDVVSKKKDIFERAMGEQAQVSSDDLRGLSYKQKEEYTKLNLSTIEAFQEEFAQHPDHNVTVRGRYTNTGVNLQYVTESFEDYTVKLRDLKELVHKVKRNADQRQPKYDLSRRVAEFNIEMKQEFLVQDKLLRDVNEDV